MSNYTHLNNIAVQGSIESSAQGKLIGSFDTMPAASSLNAGQIVLYTGATGTYVQGKYYVSNGTSWVISAASPSAVTVDSALSDTSTNPVQNKVIKAALDEKVDAEAGKGLSTNDYTTTEKNKLAGISAGAQVNVIEEVQLNGAKITPSSKAVNIDLSGYATKGDLSSIPKFAISVVSSLPTSGISTSTIYLLSNGGSSGNSYDEYLYVNGAWEKIGTTEVDLSGYVPTTRKINSKALSADITLSASDVGALPAGGTAVKATADANGNNIANTYATQTALTNGLAAKQNALTFDSAPTSGSSNPVTSGGVFSAINNLESQIPSGGTAGQVWTSDGDGQGRWEHSIPIETFGYPDLTFEESITLNLGSVTCSTSNTYGSNRSKYSLSKSLYSEGVYFDTDSNKLKRVQECRYDRKSMGDLKFPYYDTSISSKLQSAFSFLIGRYVYGYDTTNHIFKKYTGTSTQLLYYIGDYNYVQLSISVSDSKITSIDTSSLGAKDKSAHNLTGTFTLSPDNSGIHIFKNEIVTNEIPSTYKQMVDLTT